MALNDLISQIVSLPHLGNLALGLFVLVSSIIQIAPIKLNPWDVMLGWIGSKVNRKQQESIEQMDRRLSDLEAKVTNAQVKDMRQAILDYAKECRADIEHTEEDWLQILDIMEEYESFCTNNHIKNGRVKENTKYLRGLYQRLSDEHRLP